MENIIDYLQNWVAAWGLKVLAAIVILIVGSWIAKIVKNIVKKILTRRQMDGTIVSFVSSLVHITLIIFVIIAAIAKLDYNTSSLIAVIGAAGLAIGLALQGSLSNFAAGFLLIIFRPFREGHYIEGAGTAGIVENIQLFTTTLVTPDNKMVIIPNGKLTGDNIINFTAKGTRRVELVAGVSYSDDLDKVREVLQKIIDGDERILKDPEPMIVVKELADSSVNFVVRVWVKAEDYWDVFFNTTEKIKKSFDAEGISIPFPQRDVHLYEHKE